MYRNNVTMYRPCNGSTRGVRKGSEKQNNQQKCWQGRTAGRSHTTPSIYW